METRLYKNLMYNISKVLKESLDTLENRYTLLEFHHKNAPKFKNYFILNESYGTLTYSRFEKESIKKTVKDINRTKFIDKVSIEGNLYYKYTVQLNKEWLTYFDIYVDPLFKQKETDSLVLFDDIIINSNNSHYYAGKINSKNVPIYKSILILGNKDNYDLESIIYHELKHIFDEYKNPNINHDLLNNHITVSEIEYNQVYAYLIDQNNEYRKNFLPLLKNPDMIINFFCISIYLMNDSEIQARIENAKEQIKRIYNKEQFNNYKNILVSSSIVKEYLDFYNVFRLLKNYVNDEIKRNAINNDVFKYILNNVYDNVKEFKNLDKKDEIEQFNSFVEYFSGKIYNKFLRHCASYAYNELELGKEI